jgi:hypothetical protein
MGDRLHGLGEGVGARVGNCVGMIGEGRAVLYALLQPVIIARTIKGINNSIGFFILNLYNYPCLFD